ncbi:MAG: hypothetical protein M3Y71_15590 [Actinomycetota bacterium]|nr:hypothetical protein [Actinomycetota bacterium]
MTSNSYPASHPSPLPVLAAVVVGAAALLHLAFGSTTPTRSVLAVVAMATGLLVGVVATRPRTTRVALTALTLTGLGAAALLGVTYL